MDRYDHITALYVGVLLMLGLTGSVLALSGSPSTLAQLFARISSTLICSSHVSYGRTHVFVCFRG